MRNQWVEFGDYGINVDLDNATEVLGLIMATGETGGLIFHGHFLNPGWDKRGEAPYYVIDSIESEDDGS